jgi:hypothetical protein
MEGGHVGIKINNQIALNFQTKKRGEAITRFGIMGTRLTALGEEDRGPAMSRPTQPRDSG